MPKPYFFYATGTATVISLFNGKGFGDIGYLTGGKTQTIPGYNGLNGTFGASITTDPFPSMLNPNKWQAVKIGYPAAAFPMLSSIADGVAKTVRAIDALPAGTPFALGGYSQGAAVMSLVLSRHLQTNSSWLVGLPNITSRYTDLKAGVVFGNPCRKLNSLWPAFKSYAGGSISATTANPSGTTGGHGCFPSSYRLTTVPSYWYEFVGSRDNPVDIITSIGDDTTGTNFVNAAADLLNFSWFSAITVLLDAVKRGAVETILALGSAGHMNYPLKPPPGYASTAPTSYQIALEYLDMIGDKYVTAPSQIPDPSKGATSIPQAGPVRGFAPSRPTTVQPPPPVRGRGFR